MKNVNLYNQDGSLYSEAQLLLSSRPDEMSLAEWRKRMKDFKFQLSTEDLKEFEKIRKKKLQSEYHISKQRDAKRKKQELIANTKKINLYNQDGSLCSEAQLLIHNKPNDISMSKWRKTLKEFRFKLSSEDLKEFEILKKSARDAKWYAENIEKVKERDAKWYAENIEKVKEKDAKWYAENTEKVKQNNAKWYAENIEKVKEKDAKWYAENTERAKENSAKWRAENPDYHAEWRAANPEKVKKERSRPENKLRSAVSNAFKRIRQNKPTDTLDLLGCTWEEAKAHIENLFQEGMTWENHGRGEGKWQIDHIRPVASFKGASEEELKQMNHISNLQPLWAADNRSKSDKWEEN